MKLSQCKIGTLVCIKEEGKITHIGHIVDLDIMYDMKTEMKYSDPDELLNDVRPFVKFAGEKLPRPVHPGNLYILKD